MIKRLAGRTNPRKLSSGLIFMGIGIVGFIWAQEYTIGTATQMGAGYFPAMLGILLTLLGAAAIVQALRSKTVDEEDGPQSLKPLALILFSIVSFGFTIGHAGLVPAIFVSILFACMQRIRSHPIEVILIFAVLATFSSVTFVHFFGMPIPLFLWPF
ncbi:MAG: tripartite tricarboxylate transporter TctB family protein [Dongiaceae bacterium]